MGAIKGDTRSLDYSSFRRAASCALSPPCGIQCSNELESSAS